MRAMINLGKIPVFSGMATFLTVMLIITPLCGLLFQCGCDWPWAGLHTGCNFYQADARFHCPWCESMITGILATGLSILSGTLVTVLFPWIAQQNPAIEITIRITSGLAVFIIIATLAALMAAWVQGYPLGIGQYVV